MPAPRMGCSSTDASHSSRRVAGVAGGVGDAEGRADGLELAGVPEAEPGHQRPEVEQERSEEHEERGRRVGQRPLEQCRLPGVRSLPGADRDGRGRHHRSATPHMTPHALTTTDAMTSDHARSQPTRERPASAMPSATRIIAKGAKSLLKR